MRIKKTWIKWSGGNETRDDGYALYHNLTHVMLRYPNGELKKFRSETEAKREVDKDLTLNKQNGNVKP